MKKNNSSLSILLLTYNNLNSTKKCIESLYKYTTNFNLIIVDNASTDGTVEYLKDIRGKNKNIILSFQKKNLGIVKGRNHAYKKISYYLFPSAEYIFFLDNDQEVLPGWQQSYMEFFEQGYDVIGCEAWKMREIDFYPYRRLRSREKTSCFSYVGCGGLMVKSKVVEDIGLFDERFSPAYFEDPDFVFRAYETGYKIGWNYNPVIEHKKHNLSLKGERKKYFMENWKKFQEKWKEKKIPVFRVNL